jgi:formylglycine-generating enzyme required for sulfatase activity
MWQNPVVRTLTAALFLVGLSAMAAGQPEPKAFPLWDGKETVAEYAKRAGLEPTKTLDLGNDVKLELVLIPAGKFMMGSPPDEKGRDEGETQHEVTLTKPFYLGKYEVTQEQYQHVMGTNPRMSKGRNGRFKGRDLPVERVLWDEAQEFCKKASEKTVRLPTEAEWEYACRAGTKTTYYTGDAEADLDRAAWYYKNSDKNSGYRTHPVGQKVPNAWGLYDMLGNAYEWCADWYDDYGAGAATDPQGPKQGQYRVLRGGSWHHNPGDCRSATRVRLLWSDRLGTLGLGFRVAADVPPKTP